MLCRIATQTLFDAKESQDGNEPNSSRRNGGNTEHMKFLIPDWKSFGKEDIQETLEALGHQVIYYTDEPRSYRRDPKFRSELRHFLREHQMDAVFSSNYYPILSTVCQELKMPYLSWCYDNPLVLLYSDTVFNSCNFIFLFDSQMVMDLRNGGVTQAYYLPMAVNPTRLDQLTATPAQQQILDADVSFVGALYNEKHNLYDRFDQLDEYTRGYLEGVMQAQRKIYGYHFLERVLTPDIIDRLVQTVPLQTNSDGHETLEYLYANYFLCRKMTQMDRQDTFAMLDQRTDLCTKLYTPNPTPQFQHIQNMGTVHYMMEMPLVFRYSRINLNITLRSIANGIPLRAMDIMGAGGFLLTNHQNDFAMHFVEGEDYISYDSPKDMMDKIDYYLEHEEERQTIAANGCQKVCAEHTYEQRLKEMLSVLG